MSQDVFIGSTDRNWSRDLDDPFEPDNQQPPLTDKEKFRIERLAELEMRAANGDVSAQKKMVEINGALAVIQKKAKKGDAKSKRLLYTLQGTGLLTLSESKTGPKLVMAGAGGRTRRVATRQPTPGQQADPAQQVQEFLLNLKMRAMAGDPQAINILNQYQQIIAPPGGGQPEGPQAMQLDSPPPGMAPEGYPSAAPMAGDDESRQARREKVRILKERAAAGDSEAIAALQILKQHRAARRARRSASDESGFNGHLAFIRGIDGDDAGAWLYKLNPRYWLKSKDERIFEDIEHEKWQENAKLNKAAAQRKLALEQGLRAKQAADAVKVAKAQATENDAQLNAILSSLSGDSNRHLAFIRGLGEEEIALAMEGGQCERNALVRRASSETGIGRSRYHHPRRNVAAASSDPETQAVINTLRPWNGKSIRSNSTLKQLISALTPLANSGNQKAIQRLNVFKRTLLIPESQR